MRLLYDIFYFYRILHWQNKLAWSRGLAYVIVGYAVAAQFKIIPLVAYFLAISGICMCAYALNDFYDYKRHGENNFLAACVHSGRMSERKAFTCSFLPLSFLVFLFLIESRVSQIVLLLFLTITLLYSLPFLRLKQFWGWVYSPFCAAIGFCGAYHVLGTFNDNIACFMVLIFLFHMYTEMIHVLEECQTGEITSPVTQKRALVVLKIIPGISIITALICARYNLFFLAAIPFALIRIHSLKNITITSNFYAIHRNIFSALYAPYEYIVYAGSGLCGAFG